MARAADAGVTTVYRSVSPDGVVTFSDAPHPTAVPIDVIPPPPAREEDQQRAAELFDQQLRVLEILEESRRGREADLLAQQRLDLDYVRTEAALERARRLQAQDDASSYYPFYYSYPIWFAPLPYPPMGPRPPHGGPPGGPPHGGRPPPPSQHLKLP